MCFDHINFPLLHLLSDPSSHFLSFFFSLKETKNVESSFCFHIVPGMGPSTGAWLPCQRWVSVMALNKTVSASTGSHLLPTAYNQGWDFTSPFPSMPGLWLDLVAISCILSEPLCVYGCHCHIVSRKHCFLVIIHNAWPLHSFCLVVHSDA